MLHCDSTVEHCDTRVEHCDITVEHCDSTVEHCDNTVEHCDSTVENCAESVLQQIDLLKITASLLASFISFIVIFLFRTCSRRPMSCSRKVNSFEGLIH